MKSHDQTSSWGVAALVALGVLGGALWIVLVHNALAAERVRREDPHRVTQAKLDEIASKLDEIIGRPADRPRDPDPDPP